jgi:hypothetical protein
VLHIWADTGTPYTILFEGLKAKSYRQTYNTQLGPKEICVDVAQQKYCLFEANPLLFASFRFSYDTSTEQAIPGIVQSLICS